MRGERAGERKDKRGKGREDWRKDERGKGLREEG